MSGTQISGTHATNPENGQARALVTRQRARSVGAVVATGMVAVFYLVQGVSFWREGRTDVAAGGVRAALLVVALAADVATVALLLGIVAVRWHRPATAEALGWYAVLASSATSGLAFFLPGGMVLLGVLAGLLLGPALSTLAKGRRPQGPTAMVTPDPRPGPAADC